MMKKASGTRRNSAIDILRKAYMNKRNSILAVLWAIGTATARPFDYRLCKARFAGIDKRRATEQIPAHKLKKFFDQWAESIDGLASMAPDAGAKTYWRKKIVTVLAPEVGRWFISSEAKAVFERAHETLKNKEYEQ